MKHNDKLFSLYFSIPFHVENDQELTAEKGKQLVDMGWKENPIIKGERDIYDHIISLMSNENPDAAIGSTWEFDLRKLSRKRELGSHKCYETEVGGEYIPWEIKRIGLALFDTGVGMLWYELQVKLAAVGKEFKDKGDIEKILGFICETKELTRNEQTAKTYEVSNREKEGFCETAGVEVLKEIKAREGIRIDVRRKADIFEEIIYPTIHSLKIDSYFSNRQKDGKLRPDKAIPFAYIVNSLENAAEKNMPDGIGTVVRLGRGYGKKYEVTSEVEVYHPFEYSMWYSCVEGCANYVYPTREIDFFTEGGYQTRLSNYFYLFILCMGQYYSLLQFSQEVSKLPVDEKKYSLRKNAAEEMLDKIHLFKLKNMYSQVGHITQYNGFYAYLKDTLQIDALHEELEAELEVLYQFVAKKKEEKRGRTYRVVSIISALFVLVQTLVSIAEVYNYFWLENRKLPLITSVILLCIVAIGVIVWAVIGFWEKSADKCSRKERKKRKNGRG